MNEELVTMEYIFGRCKIATWATIEGHSGRIVYNGSITFGQDRYGIVSVHHEETRQKAKEGLLQGLGLVLKDIDDVKEYLTGKMDPQTAGRQRIIVG